MKQSIKGKKGGRNGKREWMVTAGLLAYLLGLMIRIPLSRMIGDKGMGFFSVGMEIYTVISVVLSYSISKAVTILIKYRIKREMFKSARRVYRDAMFLTGLVSALAAAAVFFFSESIARTLLLEHMGYLAVAAAAPAVFFSALAGVFRGYFQGMGTMIPTVHSKLLEKFIMLASTLILGSVMYHYGLKVAGLLKSTEYAAAYGAFGGALGLSVSCGIGVLHLLLIYGVYAGVFRQQIAKDTSRYTESGGQMISAILSTAFPYMVIALLYNMNYLVDQRIFNYGVNVREKGDIRALQWGVYYGKYTVVAGIAAILCIMTAVAEIPKIVQLYERQERKEAQKKMGNTVHALAVFTIPFAVFAAVAAEPLVEVLFKGDREIAVKLIQAGAGLIILFPFGYFFMNVLLRLRKIKTVIFGGLAAFLLHLLVLVLLMAGTELEIAAVVCGVQIFWLTVCITGYLGVRKYMQYAQEWLHTFGITAIAAGMAGLVFMLLCRVMLSAAGAVITLFVCLTLYLILYIILMILLKGIRQDELENMAGGRLIAVIGKKFHLF